MVSWGSVYMRVFAKFLIWGEFLRVGLYARSAYMRQYPLYQIIFLATQHVGLFRTQFKKIEK